ncbi:hypothetical protein [Virgisporangium aurantiacum]|uniref:hypothetical protein n=1 Tax=Virgisporangium aurantiacum TaxID=175570 RepID=UPI00194FFEED|nr:hypothetical protein [Virgisporangium aurantiacum]
MSEIESAFGSSWRRLEDRGEGWQLLDIGQPRPHQWPGVGMGPAGVARVTDGPVLAFWVSDTACAQISAAATHAEGWSYHLTKHRDGSCGYDHRFSTLRPDSRAGKRSPDLPVLVAAIADWACAAGLDASADRITDAVTGARLYRDLPHAVVSALGLPPGREVPRMFDHQEDDWCLAWHRGHKAGLRTSARWSTGSTVESDQQLPEDEDFLGFVDQVARSMYGGGFSRQELVEESSRLMARWSRT